MAPPPDTPRGIVTRPEFNAVEHRVSELERLRKHDESLHNERKADIVGAVTRHVAAEVSLVRSDTAEVSAKVTSVLGYVERAEERSKIRDEERAKAETDVKAREAEIETRVDKQIDRRAKAEALPSSIDGTRKYRLATVAAIAVPSGVVLAAIVAALASHWK